MPKTWILFLAVLAAQCGGSSQVCTQNGSCNAQCAADPDCDCSADKNCNAVCAAGADPDCAAGDCTQNGECNVKCAKGADPDCAAAGASQAVWPGFQGAAGTMTGKSYRVSGALVPGEYGKAAQGSTHKVDPGIRRSE